MSGFRYFLTLFHIGYFLMILALMGRFSPPLNYLLNYERYDNETWRGEWLSGLYSLRQVTEVKLGRVRSDFGWVTTEA